MQCSKTNTSSRVARALELEREASLLLCRLRLLYGPGVGRVLEGLDGEVNVMFHSP